MAYLFGTACLDLARQITDVMDSAATASGDVAKTTLIDTAMPIATPASDWYNGGTIFFTGPVNNLGLTRRITDFDQATGTFTFAAVSTRTVATNTYSVMTKNWMYYALAQAINKALMRIGDVDQQDSTVAIVANQLGYTLPSGVFNLRKVEKKISDTDYLELGHWREIEGEVQFVSGHAPDSGYLRLTYNAPIAEITSDSTAIPGNVNPEYLKWTATVDALRWRIQRVKNDDPVAKEMMNEALANAELRARTLRPLMNITPRTNQDSAWAVHDNVR